MRRVKRREMRGGEETGEKMRMVKVVGEKGRDWNL